MYLATVDWAMSIPNISSSHGSSALPQWIFPTHLSDETPNLAVDLRPSTAPARLPARPRPRARVGTVIRISADRSYAAAPASETCGSGQWPVGEEPCFRPQVSPVT